MVNQTNDFLTYSTCILKINSYNHIPCTHSSKVLMIQKKKHHGCINLISLYHFKDLSYVQKFLTPSSWFWNLCLQKCPATIILEEWVTEVMEMSSPNRPLCSSLNSLKPSSHQGPPHCILTDLPFFEMAGNDFNPQNYSVYK